MQDIIIRSNNKITDKSYEILKEGLRNPIIYEFESEKNIVYEIYFNNNQIGTGVLIFHDDNRIIDVYGQTRIEGKYELSLLSILKEYRHKKIGRFFMNYLKKNYKDPIFIPSSASASSFYLKCGCYALEKDVYENSTMFVNRYISSVNWYDISYNDKLIKTTKICGCFLDNFYFCDNYYPEELKDGTKIIVKRDNPEIYYEIPELEISDKDLNIYLNEDSTLEYTDKSIIVIKF